MEFEEWRREVEDFVHCRGNFEGIDHGDGTVVMKEETELHEIYKQAVKEGHLDKLVCGCVVCPLFVWKPKITCKHDPDAVADMLASE